ncbi:MAG: hypothetical protein UZ22_OP11002000536 [Microgenomates bacterium OLB23]|nr:MAG: hypothetical protein UZ22_OP11002000536 [Microgenomates bacterium OLB23]
MSDSKPTTIKLSHTTQALIEALTTAPKPQTPPEGEAYEVSQTVTFLGVFYEKIRNSIEFNEEHLIRRMAISRILRRRLPLNLSGHSEAENLIRELMWGNYLRKRSIGKQQVAEIQKVIDDYVYLYERILKNACGF